jgi:hypothetical protein
MKIVISIKSNGIHEYAEMDIKKPAKDKYGNLVKDLENAVKKYNKKMVELA